MRVKSLRRASVDSIIGHASNCNPTPPSPYTLVILLTRCQSFLKAIRFKRSSNACCLSSGHESNAAASLVAPHNPTSFPFSSSLVSLERSAHVKEIGAGSALAIGNFTLEYGSDVVRQRLEPQSHTTTRIAVNDLRIAHHLHVLPKRYAHQQQRAFRDLCLSVHVEPAGADVLRAGDARNVFPVKKHVNDEARAVVASALFLCFKASVFVVRHGGLLRQLFYKPALPRSVL